MEIKKTWLKKPNNFVLFPHFFFRLTQCDLREKKLRHFWVFALASAASVASPTSPGSQSKVTGFSFVYSSWNRMFHSFETQQFVNYFVLIDID